MFGAEREVGAALGWGMAWGMGIVLVEGEAP